MPEETPPRDKLGGVLVFCRRCWLWHPRSRAIQLAHADDWTTSRTPVWPSSKNVARNNRSQRMSDSTT